MRTALLATALLFCLTFIGCATAPETAAERKLIQTEAKLTLKEFQRMSPATYKSYIAKSKGYAVFPEVGKGGAIIGGAYGKGVLYEGSKLSGYCKLEEINVGLQFGGQEQSMIMFFKDNFALARFKSGEVAGDASVAAVIADADAAATADFKNGVATFTFDSAGAMYQASVGGKRFKYVPKEAYD